MNVKRILCVAGLALAFALPALTTACGGGGHHYYRVYDPDYRDYHRWDDHEVIYYNQWAAENHRDAHRDFRKLNHDEQREYWKWRHDRDHDHDH